MELRQLRYFAAVHDAGSLSRAAAACHVAQSALSYQIANLEEELGVTLFDRQPRGMAPTPDGIRLYGHARRILQAAEDARQDLQSRAGEVAGEITLGLPYTALEMIGLPLVERAASTFPALQLWIAESLSSQALSNLLGGAVDLALLYNPPDSSDIQVSELLTEKMLCIGLPALIGKARAPIPFDEVATLPQLMLRRGDAARAVISDPALLDRVMRQSRIELISTNMLKKALVEGFGCAIGPPATYETLLRDPSLHARAITRPTIRRRLCIARLAGRTETRAEAAVAALVTDLVREAVADGRWKATLSR